jgi:hypothetical protein
MSGIPWGFKFDPTNPVPVDGHTLFSSMLEFNQYLLDPTSFGGRFATVDVGDNEFAFYKVNKDKTVTLIGLDSEWGNISGDITRQADLIAYIQAIMSTVPPGGLRPPIETDLESDLQPEALLTADDVGLFYIVQDMDVLAPGRSGKAWANFKDGNENNPVVWYKVYDQYYSADGVSIILTPTGKLQVSTEWLSGIIATALSVHNTDPTAHQGTFAPATFTLTNAAGNETLPPVSAASPQARAQSLRNNIRFILDNFARLASPAFSGTPTAPTAPVGTNNQQIATTQYVQQNMTAFSGARASGIFQNRSLASATRTIITPLNTTASGFQGNANLISGNAFRADSSGLWLLSIYGGVLSVNVTAPSLISVYKGISDLGANTSGGALLTAQSSAIPSITVVLPLTTGELLSFWIISNQIAQSGIGTISYTFKRIA